LIQSFPEGEKSTRVHEEILCQHLKSSFCHSWSLQTKQHLYCAMQRIPVRVLLWYRYSSIFALSVYIPMHKFTYAHNLCVCIYIFI